MTRTRCCCAPKCAVFRAIICSFFFFPCSAWTSVSLSHRIRQSSISNPASVKRLPFLALESVESSHKDAPDSKASSTSSSPSSATLLKELTAAELVDDDAPAGIVGAEFFGGNKQKQEFYDPIAEATAGSDFLQAAASNITFYNRFDDRGAFDKKSSAIAEQLQMQINAVLYQNKEIDIDERMLEFDDTFHWETPLQIKRGNLLEELQSALSFYRHVDLAITGGSFVDQKGSVDVFDLRWELSFEWPIFWEPRVLITGTSRLEVVTNTRRIVRQLDRLDNNNDLLKTIRSQILPRFWDVYHIGMTPSAELSPRLAVTGGKKPSLFSNYRVSCLPPRLYLQATLLDFGSREDALATVLPNHAFGCVIKTMGPQKQRFVPTSPTSVQINFLPQQSEKLSNDDKKSQLTTTSATSSYNGSIGDRRQIQWLVPMSVEFVAQHGSALPIPIPDFYIEQTDDPRNDPKCQYVWTNRRLIATMPYGGGPQDVEIAKVRKQLFEQVTRDGWTVKLDAFGRPCFLFFQNSVKTCYTGEGLGMAVYEWRPKFVNTQEVGLELEM